MYQNGAEFDARKGSSRSRRADGGVAKFYDGIFKLSARPSGDHHADAVGEADRVPEGKASVVAAAKKPKTRKLWGDGKGKFRTRGQYTAATIRGTKWLVQDSCTSTLTKVTQASSVSRTSSRRRRSWSARARATPPARGADCGAAAGETFSAGRSDLADDAAFDRVVRCTGVLEREPVDRQRGQRPDDRLAYTIHRGPQRGALSRRPSRTAAAGWAPSAAGPGSRPSPVGRVGGDHRVRRGDREIELEVRSQRELDDAVDPIRRHRANLLDRASER